LTPKLLQALSDAGARPAEWGGRQRAVFAAALLRTRPGPGSDAQWALLRGCLLAMHGGSAPPPTSTEWMQVNILQKDPSRCE